MLQDLVFFMLTGLSPSFFHQEVIFPWIPFHTWLRIQEPTSLAGLTIIASMSSMSTSPKSILT